MMNIDNYIEKYILPYEDDNLKINYYEGTVGYDEGYLAEHIIFNGALSIMDKINLKNEILCYVPIESLWLIKLKSND